MVTKGPGIEVNFDPCIYPSGNRKGQKNANMRIFFSGRGGDVMQVAPPDNESAFFCVGHDRDIDIAVYCDLVAGPVITLSLIN